MNNRNRRSPFNPNSFRDTSVVRRHGDSSSRLPVLNKPGGKSSTGPLSSRDLSYSRYFSQGSENDETRRSVERESIPRTYAADDDLPLDAFDRELLAQLNEGQPQQHDHSQPGATAVDAARPVASYQLDAGPFRTPGPKQGSRLFESSSGSRTTTPFRGPGSNFSELGTPSSPLSRLRPQGKISSLEDNSLIKSISHLPSGSQSHQLTDPSFHNNSPTNSTLPCPSRRRSLSHAPPIIQGITLVSVHELPDRFRSLFPFPVFNAIQSKCFEHVYHSDDNLVLAAPTGSGKTVVMELAICRLVNSLKDGLFKVVYQAPTKSLCTERFRDWSAKFTSLGLKCAELTGDTDYTQLKTVQSAAIIVTTPEKWDSMTRKWKDHARLMQLVKLFLIDEVHILKEARGATLEAVVSRMKSAGSNVRFVALSATVPNSEDIATWLGKDSTNQHLPAHRERFGEEFRPVKLEKFVYGYQSNGNDFAFDKVCGAKLPEVIAKHSCRKPIMIFCCTRNSSIATAKDLANLWSATNPPKRLWKGPSKTIQVQNPDLRTTIASGVAFHHAGLDAGDRHAVENGFLEGQISIICCTSTLAVGVNLPCHLVIIKNTVGWQDGGCKEYSDLEMMQMLGRAGRPQFDDSAVAVILTRKERVHHYEKLISGSEFLESCLHLNLIDHLNAEIGLGNVTDIASATKWLAGTFLFVRLRRNPTHYKLREGADRRDEDEMLCQICEKDVKLLQECNLVSSEGKLKSTQLGEAMARYYVKFETMRILLALPPKAKMSEILSAISQAEEFREIRLKSGEKSLYKEINRTNGIKFPIKVDIALPAHKISLLIQSELGAVEFPANEQFQKHKPPFQQDKAFVFSHINRLIRCVIDCLIHLQDSIAVRHALELARSFGARVWDNSPLQMKQIDQIGIVAVRKLASAGITSMEALELTEAHRIDMVLSRNPPFGVKLLARLGDFPKLRVTVKMMGKEAKPGKPVKVNFKADIGFINEKIPVFFQRRPVYVCFLAETSDGHMIDFRRMGANKLQNGHEVLLSAELKSAFQHITCYVMCDDIAGTLRYAELKPEIPAYLFPIAHPENEAKPAEKPTMNTSRRRSNDISRTTEMPQKESEEFEGDDLEYMDLTAAAESMDRVPIDDESIIPQPAKSDQIRKLGRGKNRVEKRPEVAGEHEPTKLPNGKWACNHKCKDKTACKHFCCRDGLEKPPRVSKKQQAPSENQRATGLSQLTLSASIKKDAPAVSNTQKFRNLARAESIELLDLTQPLENPSSKPNFKPVNQQKKQAHRSDSMKSQSQATKRSTSQLEFTKQTARVSSMNSVGLGRSGVKSSSSDYGGSCLDDLPSPSALLPDGINASAGGHSGRENNSNLIKADKDDGSDSNESLIGLDDPWLLSQPDNWNNELEKGPKGKNVIDYSIDTTNEAEREIQPSSLDSLDPFSSYGEQGHSPFLKTSSDPTLNRTPEPEVIAGKKRAAIVIDEDAGDNGGRKKQRLCFPGTDDNELENAVINPSVDTDHEENVEFHASSTVPKDWEGIDPLLLEEFKDVVNFF